MEFHKSKIENLYLIKPFHHADNRGAFIKPFDEKKILEIDPTFKLRECYFSISQKNVIRGMHFQVPEHNVSKIVYVARGAVKDVVLDLRKDSKTYGEYEVFELSESNRDMLYVPEGCAHGFLSLEDNTQMTYFQSLPFDKECDAGIHFGSFGYDWGIAEEQLIFSDRDAGLPKLSDFDSPFLL
ncbi:dTDP-4-dehydrorhamnose 3,5-epimerase family protein [Halobacteriovorax sp. GB3]|uniref:dTDP-4-dehydrorhamnose 3,5-epimerase family protein n=1 Tax=Halobacteriovorax sp. GB3 TaxID=2719615 RepID=UPI00235FCEB2|nr:dTDP-4-dehydrorhamnose 3,5-epimerase family protein [Halobacteriovorax sp. GB3]MDD0852537.1 dTDP-4-dehydrorhamnose 3,5-epimerase family protein [Halobacteriovorax sp. GB3]